MKIALIGLGKMGSNMAIRLLRGGHQCVVYDQQPQKAKNLERHGATPLESLRAIQSHLDTPAVVWLMLPSGQITEGMVSLLSEKLSKGDILIDGGNSHYKDAIERAKQLQTKKIKYLDVGVSGGVWGLERGYSLMIGGDPHAAEFLDPLFKTLAPGPNTVPASHNRAKTGKPADSGYVYCGPAGAGHFVKMIHNGIEYGMMQSLAEGFSLLRGTNSPKLPEEQRYSLNVTEIAEVWRRGSVISSWLLDLIALSLNHDPELSEFHGHVPDSGEGRWTVQAALDQGTPAEVLATALFVRFRSRIQENYANQLLSAMRQEFGGHQELDIRRKVS